METNTKTRDAMLEMISQINAVEGFDPSAFAEEYECFDGNPSPAFPSPYRKRGSGSNTRRGG